MSALLKGMIHMITWKIKNCPRCGGDVYIDEELGGAYEQCLQCGYEHHLPARSSLTSTAAIRRRRDYPSYPEKFTPEADAVFGL